MTLPLAARTTRLKSSAIRELLKVTQQPDVISLAGGFPAPELFPVEALARASQRVFERHGTHALQYGPTEGVSVLRAHIASSQPYASTADNVLITTGSQQGLFLACQALLDPGDLVVLETPTYLGAIQTFDAHQAEYLLVESDGDGLIPESLDQVLSYAAKKPKFVYAIPNHQNPSGVTMSAIRRAQVVAIAEKHDVLILEDDPYGALTFDGKTPPPLRAFSDTHVVYLGSFSKVFAPGLRVGYTIPPERLFKYLVRVKQAADLHTGMLDQYLVFEAFSELDFDAHLARLRATYAERCEAMLASLARQLPKGSTWTRPSGGLFIWVELPIAISTNDLLKRAIAHKVAFVPGAPFCLDGKGDRAMRLNFSNVSAAIADEGIARIAGLLATAPVAP